MWFKWTQTLWYWFVFLFRHPQEDCNILFYCFLNLHSYAVFELIGRRSREFIQWNISYFEMLSCKSANVVLRNTSEFGYSNRNWYSESKERCKDSSLHRWYGRLLDKFFVILVFQTIIIIIIIIYFFTFFFSFLNKNRIIERVMYGYQTCFTAFCSYCSLFILKHIPGCTKRSKQR